MATFDPVLFDPATFDAGEPASGVAASEFGFSTSAAGSEDQPGTAISVFGWSTESVGDIDTPVTGTSDVTFGTSPGLGTFDTETFDPVLFDTLGGTLRSWLTAVQGAVGAAGAAASDFIWRVVARGHGVIETITNDALYNAWPNAVRITLDNGSILMAYTKGNAHNTDNSGNVVGRISYDNGASWGDEFVIADETLGAINVSLVALASGRVLVAYNLFDAPNTPTDSVRVRYSDDFGLTWSAAITVNTAYTSTVTNGSALMIQRADGTVMMAVYGLNTSQTFYSASVLFSTDNGETWGGEVQVANGTTDGRHYYEPSLTLLNNGDILCMLRNDDLRTIFQSRSTDGGATWSAPVAAFAGWSPANAIQLLGGTVFSPIRDAVNSKLEGFVSLDNAATWFSIGILDDTSYAEIEYACPVVLSGNSVLVIYSVQPTSAITNADIRQVYVSLPVPDGISDAEFGWSTESSGLAGEAPEVGTAASSFGWSIEATGEHEFIDNRSHIAFSWATESTGIAGVVVVRAKNRRLRPLLLPKGVWYQPYSNPEARLNE